MKTRIAALAACILAVIAIAMPAGAITGPFTWSGHTWCPTGYPGTLAYCNAVQSPGHTISVVTPWQTGVSGKTLELHAVKKPYTLNGTTYPWQHGMVTSEPNETYRPGWVGARIYLPCDASGLIENWPAFWGSSATRPWPSGGEIDVLEGLRGYAAWHYHYLGSDGKPAQIGGRVPGDWCGWHKYTVYRGGDYLTFRYDGKEVGHITSADIGQPVSQDPYDMRFNFSETDYPNQCCSGPLAQVTMRIAWLGYTP